MIRFTEERWAEFYRDAAELFPQHWRELAVFQDRIKMDCDLERYEKLDAAGILNVLAARADGALVGYMISFVMPHMHYRSAGPMALADMYFVLPEYRFGVGAQLFAEWESRMRVRGVVQMMTSCKVSHSHKAFLERMGWQNTDLTFAKCLLRRDPSEADLDAVEEEKRLAEATR